MKSLKPCPPILAELDQETETALPQYLKLNLCVEDFDFHPVKIVWIPDTVIARGHR